MATASFHRGRPFVPQDEPRQKSDQSGGKGKAWEVSAALRIDEHTNQVGNGSRCKTPERSQHDT